MKCDYAKKDVIKCCSIIDFLLKLKRAVISGVMVILLRIKFGWDKLEFRVNLNKMLSRRVYRIIARSSKYMFMKKNRALLEISLESFLQEIEQMTCKDTILNKIPQQPLQTVKECFRKGTNEDMTIFLSFLPKLFRYLRIPEVMNNALPPIRKPTAIVNITKSQYNLGPGAKLISNLNYNEKQLENRDIKYLFDTFLSSMNEELQAEVQKLLSSRRDLNLPKEELSYMDKRRKRIFYVLMALDKLIRRKEFDRIRGNRYEHFIDQIIQPQSDYLRGMPITYSVLYCSLVNSLDIDLEAYGVPFPKHFLSRIVVKNYANADDHMLTLEQQDDTVSPFHSQGGSAFTWRELRKSGPQQVSVQTLTGSWVCCTDSGFSEFQFVYDKENMCLKGSMVLSGDSMHDGEDTRHHWYVNLNHNLLPNQTNPTTMLSTGQMYHGWIVIENNHHNSNSSNDINNDSNGEVAEKASAEPEMKECTIEIVSLSSEVLGSPRKGIPTIRGPYLEVQIKYRGDEQHSLEADQVKYYCRSIDLDWCLLDISDQGIVPITPLNYIASLERYYILIAADTLLIIDVLQTGISF